MLTVACKPVRYQVFAAEEGRWSPTNDLVLNYKGIYRQLIGKKHLLRHVLVRL